jgi:uroporphyrinogen-III synthase
MFGLINTRPSWNEGDDLWVDSLRFELKNIEVLNAPLQTLSLTSSEIVGGQLDLWLRFISSNSSSGYLVFTSPASVKAFDKHLKYFEDLANQSFGTRIKYLKIIESLRIGIYDQRIKAAVIGSGTKRKLIELTNKLFIADCESKNFFLNEMLFVKENADSLSFLELYKNEFNDENLLVLEGEGNKRTLVNGLIPYSATVESLILYKREKQSLPSLISFFNKVVNKDQFPKKIINFNKQVFLLLSSSTIANLAKKELKKQKVILNSMIVLSHHDRIIKIMKEECDDIEFSKILSLSPKLIAKEVRKHIA